jgi:RNA processing factor Prp31
MSGEMSVAMTARAAHSMKDLFRTETLDEVKERMALLRPGSERLWGKMTAAQMLAHCAATMEMAVGLPSPEIKDFFLPGSD